MFYKTKAPILLSINIRISINLFIRIGNHLAQRVGVLAVAILSADFYFHCNFFFSSHQTMRSISQIAAFAVLCIGLAGAVSKCANVFCQKKKIQMIRQDYIASQ